jgi:serine/threonine-protein kinase
MGVVYKGHDPAIDRHVAIKTIHADLLAGDDHGEWRERFQREARAAGRCLHPNIVAVFDYAEQDGTPFIAMEYVQGRELHDMLRQGGGVPLADALSIIGQLLAALAYAHSHGIVHRDIKPGNIILVDGGQVKVTDFGIARIDQLSMTSHGSVVGTPSYMAPEQFTGDPVDHRADIFAAGVVLFELLTGEKPFPGQRATEVMYKVLNDPPRQAAEINREVSPALGAVVARALARWPDDRFQGAAEFARALDEAGRGGGEAAGDATISLARPQSGLSALDAAVIERVEQDLTHFIGPVARVLARKAARLSTSVEEMYRLLATNIPGERERAEFMERMRRNPSSLGRGSLGRSRTGTGAGTRAPTLPQEELDRAEKALVAFVGPIARILVRKAGADSRTVEELWERLAGHVPTEGERRQFLARRR